MRRIGKVSKKDSLMIFKRIIICLIIFIFSFNLAADTLQVGPTKIYKKPSEVANLVKDGDVVLIDAGEYVGDVAAWYAGTFIRLSTDSDTAKVINNLFMGAGTTVTGPAKEITNLKGTDTDVVDRAGYDYHLTAGSKAIDAGSDPGAVNSFYLQPLYFYDGYALARNRPADGTLDIGAYEYSSANSITKNNVAPNIAHNPLSIGPNPLLEFTTITYELTKPAAVQFTIFNQQGKLIKSMKESAQIAGIYKFIWDGRDNLGQNVEAGVYYINLLDGTGPHYHKIVVR